MNCPNCGFHYEGEMAFCAHCGTPLKQNEQEFGMSSAQGQTSGGAQEPNYGGPQGQGYGGPQGAGYGGPQGAGYGGPQGPNYGGPQGPNYGGPQGPNYGGPQGPNYGGFGGGFRAPIQNRNIGLCIVLSIVTCGIYGIYWFICLVNDLNVASDSPADTSGGVVFLLSLVTCNIYALYWFYKAGEKVSYINRRTTGYGDTNNGILYLLLAFFGLSIVSYCLIQNELNKVASM